jgi:hypothetical protein
MVSEEQAETISRETDSFLAREWIRLSIDIEHGRITAQMAFLHMRQRLSECDARGYEDTPYRSELREALALNK